MIKIQNYYSEDPGKVPSKDNLDVGQLWINIKDKKIGTKDSKNVIQQWSQFDPAEKQQALNSIPKTGNIADITMSNAAKQSTGNTININDDSNVVVAHTLENGTTTITIEKTTGFKATQLVLSKPEGITAQISWVGVDHWLSTVDVPVFGKDAAAQELSVAIFSSPTSVAVNVIYNTETPIDSDITEAKWGNITGNLIDQSDLQAALSLKANASDIPDTSDVLTKTEASTTYLGISAKAASAAQADTAVKATQDASGNVITTTYATKDELSTKLDASDAFTKATADTLYLGKTAKAASATTADTATSATSAVNATKATQDASGNVITTTYATKSEVNTGLAGKANSSHTHTIANVTGLQDALNAASTQASNAIPKEGDRGILSGYEQFYDSPTDIDKTAPDTMVLTIGDVVNVLNAEDNIVWTKTIHMTQGSVTLGSGWVWVGGTAPTLKFPGLLILHNSNGIGIANFITGAS